MNTARSLLPQTFVPIRWLAIATILVGSLTNGFCRTDTTDQDTYDQLKALPQGTWPPDWFDAKSLENLKISLAPEYFYWREIVNDQTFVHEFGFRMGLELSYKDPVEQGWLWASRAKVYGGQVEYHGGLQNIMTGVTTPLNSTTDYIGFLLEARYGYRWAVARNYSLDAMAGISVDFWDRHLNGAGGYDEYWIPLTAKAGLDFSPRTTGVFGSIGAKIPFFTWQEIDLGNGDTFGLNPQPMVTGYAELGYQFTRHVSASAFFDSYWFRQSPTVQHDNFLATQPESITYEAGGKVTWTF